LHILYNPINPYKFKVNSKFIQTGDELAEHVKKQLPSIFDDDFGRKFVTIWSTLGYYKEDFLLKDEP
jgi:hypothetical protein